MQHKMMLLEKTGLIACLGLEEVLEGTEEECTRDYMNFLVANEGFEFHEDDDKLVRDGEVYLVVAEPEGSEGYKYEGEEAGIHEKSD